MAKKLIVGNWKMNPNTVEEARRIARKVRQVAGSLSRTDIVICPPFVFIPACISRKRPPNMSVGAQSASFEEGGAHTGEVSAFMLRDMGVEYVIAGHSEQREHGDTDAVVSQRIRDVLDAGLTAIVCVGEKTRDENGSYLETLKEQIRNTFVGIPQKQAKNIILAYEPVWAIGATEAMNPEQVYETSIFVKKVFADIFGQDMAMKLKVLYGGSVHFRNAADIIIIGKVDGLLVGRESVNMPGFVELVKVVDGIR